MSYLIEGPLWGTSSICMPVLHTLPEWFGLEAALQQYAAEIDHLPTFLVREAGQVLGFLSLKQHNNYAAEVIVMGVRPEAHRRGVGRALMDEAQKWLRQQQVEYLQVKTLGPSHSDANYARTREFYLALGFRPLEEFKQIWDENNPCLLLVKRL